MRLKLLFNEETGRKAGFLLSFFLFSAVLYFALSFLNKIPSSWTYFHALGIALAVPVAGGLLKRLLR